jgi:hypothetical protein
MPARLKKGMRVKAVNGHVGTIAVIKRGVPYPYYLDRDDIEEGQPLDGPYEAKELVAVSGYGGERP